jgi:drug/metabolite transporter (DMT)-like permease
VHAGDLFRGRLLRAVIRNKWWLTGIGLEVLGFFAQAFALHNGSLALVQPLLITDVVFLLLFLHFGFKNPVGRQGFIGVALLVAGLSCLLAVARPRGGNHPVSFDGWVLAVCVIALIILLAATAMRRIRQIPVRAAIGGFAAGLHFAFTAAFTKLVVTELHYGVWHTLFSWQLLGLAVVGISSAITMQSMYGAGPLAITQPALEITEALAGIQMGLLLFGDHVNTSIGALAVEAFSGLLAAIGIVLLTRTTSLQKPSNRTVL